MIKMKIKDTHLHILTKFKNISKEVENELESELDNLGLDIMNNIKMKMRNTAKQNKATGSKGHRPSVAGAPPAIDSGRLVNSFQSSRIGTFLEVGTNVEYAKYLQKGTKGGIIRTKDASILTNGSTFFGKQVQHPGMKPRPFLEAGLEGIDIDGRVKGAIMRGLGI